MIRFCAHDTEYEYLKKFEDNIDLRVITGGEIFFIFYLGTKIKGYSVLKIKDNHTDIKKIIFEDSCVIRDFYVEKISRWQSIYSLRTKLSSTMSC